MKTVPGALQPGIIDVFILSTAHVCSNTYIATIRQQLWTMDDSIQKTVLLFLTRVWKLRLYFARNVKKSLFSHAYSQELLTSGQRSLLLLHHTDNDLALDRPFRIRMTTPGP